MNLTFDAFRRTLTSAHEEALRLRYAGLVRDADLLDQTLVRIFFPLTQAIMDDTGALRAFRQLLDLTRPAPIDALVIPDFGIEAVRLTAVAAVPALEDLQGLEELRAIINAAIMVGAPTYNEGDPRGCGVIYWATAFTLVNAPVTRGFPGQARALKVLRQAVEETMPLIGMNPQGIDDFAWRMRRALDAALAVSG